MKLSPVVAVVATLVVLGSGATGAAAATTVGTSFPAGFAVPTDASLGNAFSETQVRALPLEAGNVPDLLSLQAGVAYTGNRTDINLNTPTGTTPAPVPVAAGVSAASAPASVAHADGSGNGHNGANGANGHRTEPAWLQRLKAGRFEDD